MLMLFVSECCYYHNLASIIEKSRGVFGNLVADPLKCTL